MAHMSRACAAWCERLPSLAGGIFARLAPSSQQHLCGILASFKHESLVIIRECIYTIVGEKALGKSHIRANVSQSFKAHSETFLLK